MKKTYETPSVEVVKFQYRDQVVVASGLYEGVCSFKNTREVEPCAETIVTVVAREGQ